MPNDVILLFIIRKHKLSNNSRLENNVKAQEDAQQALKLDPYNVKALLAKAESLFASGKFELGKDLINFLYSITTSYNISSC